jgi:hypothetical protein
MTDERVIEILRSMESAECELKVARYQVVGEDDEGGEYHGERIAALRVAIGAVLRRFDKARESESEKGLVELVEKAEKEADDE